MNYLKLIKRGLPVILAVAGALGVVGTAVLVAKETPKCNEELDKLKEDADIVDKVKVVTKEYAPAIAVGTLTVTAIFGSVILSHKQQASILSAYKFVDHQFKKYRKTLVDIKGEDGEKLDREIIHAMCCRQDNICNFHVNEPDVLEWWYIPKYKKKFKAYERQIMEAEYHLNRNYVLGGVAAMNMLLIDLGFEPVEENEEEGWDMSSGITWIDWSHDKFIEIDGDICRIIHPYYDPEPLYDWWID